MSSHVPGDAFADAVKAALSSEAAQLARPPAGGAAAAAALGLRLRRLRHVRIAAIGAGVVALTVVVAAGWVALAGGEQAGGPTGPAARPPGATAGPGSGAAPGATVAPPSAGATTVPTLPPAGDPPSPGGDGPRAGEDRTPTQDGPPTTTVPSTSSTTAPTTTTSAPAPADPRLRVSWSDDRSGSVPLDGTSLSGVVYVFWDHVLAPPSGGSVSFWIDDPARAGAPHRVELVAPYDLEATAPGGEAYGLDLGALGSGVHQVTAEAGPGQVVTATFTVL